MPTTPPTILDVVGLIEPEPDPPDDESLGDVGPDPLPILPPVFPEPPKNPVVVDVAEEVCDEYVSELETEIDERGLLCAKGVLFAADAVVADPTSGVEMVGAEIAGGEIAGAELIGAGMTGAELLGPATGVGGPVGETRDCDVRG